MARPKGRVSGNSPATITAAAAASAQVFRPGRKGITPGTDRQSIAQPWQIEAYRHVNICGEARKAVTLFASLGARAEIGVSEPQTMNRQPSWVKSGPEVDALAELAPTQRDRRRLLVDYFTHRSIAGECYLIGRDRVDTDPGYEEDPLAPVWEIVAVTEIRKTGVGENEVWAVKMDNGNFMDLPQEVPVIRLWNPDPADRREAWSPFRSMQTTLREIEWLTKHIFAQVRSRLLSAGVWFLPDNLTFPPPPADAIEGGEEAMATMNEAELFMLSLASSSMEMLDAEEVSFPSIVMADAAALEAVDKDKLIQFWSEIDDKAMILRSDAIRRFALGFDLTPEQILGSSGIAVSGSGTGGGNVNHWGEWALEEKTIAGHIDPALGDFTHALTVSFLRPAVEGTDKVIGYDPSSVRMKQDRSKEALELNARGLLANAVTLREVGFDPETDAMPEDEFKRHLLMQMVAGNPTPEMMVEALKLLGQHFPDVVSGNPSDGGGQPGRALPPNTDDVPVQGPPEGDHEHHDSPFGVQQAADEVLILRALEKAGNILLNSGKRGRDRDRETPPHLAHCLNPVSEAPGFDFSLASTVYADLPAAARAEKERQLAAICTDLYLTGQPYTRAALRQAVKAS